MPEANRLFHLEIRQSAGAVEARCWTERPLNLWIPITLDWTPIKDRIDQLHDRSPDRIGTPLAHDQTCTAIGEFLFNAVLTGVLKDEYEQYKQTFEEVFEPSIALYLPSSLYFLPWELMRDPAEPKNQFLATQGSVIRFDPDATRNREPRDFVPQANVSLLYFCAGDVYPIKLTSSGPIITDNCLAASFDEFRNIMRDKRQAHGIVLHGHGEIDKSEANWFGTFNFQDRGAADPRGARALSQHFTPAQRTALLLSCESAWILDPGNLKFEYTVAGGLYHETRVDFVIAMQNSMDSRAADAFYRRFIDILYDREIYLDTAVREARRAVREITPAKKGTQFSYMDWWIPVVYAKSTFFQLRSNPRAFSTAPSRPSLRTALSEFARTVRDAVVPFDDPSVNPTHVAEAGLE
jgi:hypothetical protein